MAMLRVHGSQVRYLHEAIGINSRLDALQAAVLQIKLKYLDQWNEGRRRNAERYQRLFAPDETCRLRCASTNGAWKFSCL